MRSESKRSLIIRILGLVFLFHAWFLPQYNAKKVTWIDHTTISWRWKEIFLNTTFVLNKLDIFVTEKIVPAYLAFHHLHENFLYVFIYFHDQLYLNCSQIKLILIPLSDIFYILTPRHFDRCLSCIIFPTFFTFSFTELTDLANKRLICTNVSWIK